MPHHKSVRIFLAAALACASLSTARADAVDAGRALAAEAGKAAEAGDFATAAARLEQALALRPNHPGLLLQLARANAKAGRIEQAMRALEDYAAMGLIMRPDDPALQSLTAHPRVAALRAKLEGNAKPVGASAAVAAINDPRLLAEGVAVDRAAGRILIGDVHNRRVLSVDKSGRASTLVESGAHGLFGVFGMALHDGALWIASSAAPQTANVTPAEKGRAGLFLFNANGRFRKRAPLPAQNHDSVLGDLVVARSGDVYTSDSLGDVIFHLSAGGEALEPFVQSDEFHSPQGLALSADETKLAIVDYASGLHIIDRATKMRRLFPMPAHVTLHGVDALMRHGRDLIGVQNGVDPQRVVRIRMNADWSAIEGVDVIAANLPDMSEPTLATIIDGELMIVGNGQWSRFADDGSIRGDAPFDPTKILRLKLPPARP